MAADSTIQAIAQGVADVAASMKSVQGLVSQVLSSNQTQAIDWNSQEVTDALAAYDFEGADVSNALGSMSSFDTTYWPTNDQNYEKMLPSTPIVLVRRVP